MSPRTYTRVPTTAKGAQALLAKTEPLRRELARALPERPFALRFWDGSELAAHQPWRARASRYAPRPRVAHLLRAPGQLGLGRAYAAGELEADDLDRVIGLLDTFEAPPIDIAARAAPDARRACARAG